MASAVNIAKAEFALTMPRVAAALHAIACFFKAAFGIPGLTKST
jgi:hypothetical protein